MFQYDRRCTLLAISLASITISLLEKNANTASVLKKWEYLSNDKVFCSKLLSIFISYLLRPLFGSIVLKIAFVVFVYEHLFIYEISYYSLYLVM